VSRPGSGRRRARGGTPILAASFWLLVAATAAAGCGYALVGRGNTLPAHVRTIGVPPFANHSPVENVDVLVTDEVRREFQSRGSLRTQPDDQNVDGLLRGTITRVTIEPVSINADARATRYIVIVTASVEFLDQREGGKVLWANPSMTTREEYNFQSEISAVDPAAVFRQNQDALQRLAQSFARSVVTAILTGD
jgi:hypothetical protein